MSLHFLKITHRCPLPQPRCAEATLYIFVFKKLFKNQHMIHLPIPRLTLVFNRSAYFLSATEMQTLRHANVVFYDDGVSKRLLNLLPSHVKKIAQSSIQRYTERQIKTLLVDYAFTHGHVVLLKNNLPIESEQNLAPLHYADYFNIETAFVVNDTLTRNALTIFPPHQKFHLN